MTTQTQSQSKSVPLSVGRYQLSGRASTGIAGAYRARDSETSALVAAYIFPDVPTAARPDPVVAVLEATAALEHPNVLRVLDAGRDGRTGYVVTEWVEGSTLAHQIGVHARLPEANVIRYLAQIGQAMDHLRTGDEAPCRVDTRNVLIRSDGTVKLILFQLPDEKGAPTAQLAKSRVPFADLILSLGETLHEALTGQQWAPPAPPSSRRRSRPAPRPVGLTDRAERAIRRATDRDPQKRPSSCAEFLKLLRARPLTAGAPKPDARPPGSAAEDRRAFVRYSLGTGSNCTINSSIFSDGPPSTEIWPLVLQDVSAGGVGVLLARRCEPGTELSLELLSGSDRAPRSLAVRVVRVRKEQHGHWAHGCVFLAPLSEVELAALLGHVGAADTV